MYKFIVAGVMSYVLLASLAEHINARAAENKSIRLACVFFGDTVGTLDVEVIEAGTVIIVRENGNVYSGPMDQFEIRAKLTNDADAAVKLDGFIKINRTTGAMEKYLFLPNGKTMTSLANCEAARPKF